VRRGVVKVLECGATLAIIGGMTYIEPLLAVFLLIALLGLVLRRRVGRSRLLIIGWLGLWLISWPPAAWLFSRPLEVWYPIKPFPVVAAEALPQAIVVLSANVNPPQYERPYPLPAKDTYQRCAFAAWLYRHWQALPVLACGGPNAPGTEPFSSAMRNLLQSAGVPDDMIWTEERSHSTYENAVFGAEILRKHGIHSIALVVEAQSMPRAAACFRKQGIVVSAAPSSFCEFDLREIMPSWKAIERNEVTLHEALGLAWYRLRGWI
jgi:uncharacterized SAM-binding protein YcdF (DUF218 family)